MGRSETDRRGVAFHAIWSGRVGRVLLRWYSRLGLNIGEGYGMTENLALCHKALPGKRVADAHEGPQRVRVRRPAITIGAAQRTHTPITLGTYHRPNPLVFLLGRRCPCWLDSLGTRDSS
jgi:hypothetical protein